MNCLFSFTFFYLLHLTIAFMLKNSDILSVNKPTGKKIENIVNLNYREAISTKTNATKLNESIAKLNGRGSYVFPQTYPSYNYNNQFGTLLSCIVGSGENAVPMPCEYGNSYCQINMNKNENGVDVTYQCSAVCQPSQLSICTTGALSNKWSPICLIGDLSSGSTGAYPSMCFLGEVCVLSLDEDLIQGSCDSACKPSENQFCYYTDFGNKQGPLCYIGTFGLDAELVGCGQNAFCVTTYGVVPGTTQATVIGSCLSSCTPSQLIKCTQTDFGNKEGPICFVGQFGDFSPAVACLKGQVCQRETIINEYSSTVTTGSCTYICTPSTSTYCCSTDLCNGYQSEPIKYGNFYNSNYNNLFYGKSSSYK